MGKTDSKSIDELLAQAPKDENGIVYRKFTDAKKQIEDIYIAIAFKDSSEGQALIKTVLETIKTNKN